ncbi:Rrf2 family transcriptional regulator [Asticcacaulis sp. DXS10W]|uniref:Rrf2 family transcriptional regulator n=2 Tax=Asticcacaulis currens TaxID=2984210 RepID=A0ABT5IBA1_9CAUL|nr:Rrf2 family transcriptional regulator [Asticcacaulis currens]MDC7693469.1 Rrf2 family transcriptional regulator [Asticcacaulis currens]
MTSKPPSVDSAQSRASAGRPKGPSAFYGASVEYGLHAVLWLLSEHPKRASSRDLADMQGLPAAMLAKVMQKLEKAGIVSSSGGITGGYELARLASDISVGDVVDAIEGDRRLFDCKEVRRGCILFGGHPPAWSVDGVCRIHAVMLRAEKRMRAELAKTSLADLARGGRPPEFEAQVVDWFRDRGKARETARISAVKEGRRSPR